MKNRIEVTSGDKRNFTTLPNYIIRSGDKPNLFRVLAVITSYAWEASHCTASVSKIAKEAGVNRHTVINAIRTWQDRGQIEVEKIEGVGMKIKTTFDYSITDAPWSTSDSPSTAPVTREAQAPVPRQSPKEYSGKKTQKEDTGSFDRFWKEYPRKVGKMKARKVWNKIRTDDKSSTCFGTVADEIISALDVHKQQAQWKKDGGMFIPHPATWLYQMRWLDEINLEDEKKVEESKKKAYIEGDQAYKKGDKWYVITHTGQHCEYIGPRDKIEWK